MIKRLKIPGESDVDTMLRLSVIAAGAGFLYLFLRALIKFSIGIQNLFWLFDAIWWLAFGVSFFLAWGAFAVAVYILIKEKR